MNTNISYSAGDMFKTPDNNYLLLTCEKINSDKNSYIIKIG